VCSKAEVTAENQLCYLWVTSWG